MDTEERIENKENRLKGCRRKRFYVTFLRTFRLGNRRTVDPNKFDFGIAEKSTQIIRRWNRRKIDPNDSTLELPKGLPVQI